MPSACQQTRPVIKVNIGQPIRRNVRPHPNTNNSGREYRSTRPELRRTHRTGAHRTDRATIRRRTPARLATHTHNSRRLPLAQTGTGISDQNLQHALTTRTVHQLLLAQPPVHHIPHLDRADRATPDRLPQQRGNDDRTLDRLSLPIDHPKQIRSRMTTRPRTDTRTRHLDPDQIDRRRGRRGRRERRGRRGRRGGTHRRVITTTHVNNHMFGYQTSQTRDHQSWRPPRLRNRPATRAFRERWTVSTPGGLIAHQAVRAW